jgi:hypothetical protein
LPHVHSPVILHINTGHIFPIPCTNSTWFCGRSYPFWQLPDYLTYFSSKTLAQTKPSQSQAKASAYGLAWHIGKPKPPQAKPKPVASRPSQARTTLSASFLKRPLIRPKSPTISRYQTHPVIALPRRWQSLPLSLETLPSAPEFPQNDLSRSPKKPPSPATTKRKQFSKLRRTLGASLPPELVCGEVRLIAIKPPVLETVLEEERAYVYLTLPPGSHEEQDSCEECQSAECGQGNVLEPQWEFPPMPFEACTTHQCSKSQYGGKWMREKDGRRWLVTNYDDVIRALREL